MAPNSESPPSEAAIITIHSSEPPALSSSSTRQAIASLAEQVNALNARFADLVVANAEAVKEVCIRDEGVKPQNVMVVRNGLDLSLFDQLAAQPLQGPLPEGPLVAVIGNLWPVKGHRTLVEAVAKLPPALVLTAGFDPLRDSSRKSRFSISNGFLGVRGEHAINGGATPGAPPRTYVAGLFDTRGAEQPIPALVPAADWLRVDILLPGRPLSSNAEDVSNHYRMLDMRRGALLTGGSLAGMPGLAIHLRVLRLQRR